MLMDLPTKRGGYACNTKVPPGVGGFRVRVS